MIGEFATLKSNVNRLKAALEGATDEVKEQFASFVEVRRLFCFVLCC